MVRKVKILFGAPCARQVIHFLCLLLILLTFVPASTLIPVSVLAQSGDPLPEIVEKLRRGDESAVMLTPVEVDGKEYSIYLYVKEDARALQSSGTTSGSIFDIEFDRKSWERDGITGFVVLDGDTPVANETLLRRIFRTEFGGFVSTRALPELLQTAPIYVERLGELFSNPLYGTLSFLMGNGGEMISDLLKDFLAGDKSAYQRAPMAEIIKLAVTQPGLDVPSEPISVADMQYFEDHIDAIENASDVLELYIQSGKFSNDAFVRDFMAQWGDVLDKSILNKASVTLPAEIGNLRLTIFKTQPVDVSLLSFLKIFTYTARAHALYDPFQERIARLRQIVEAERTGIIKLDPTVRGAMEDVIAESAATQRGDVLATFLDALTTVGPEIGFDVGLDVGQQLLEQAYRKWAWQTFGTRTLGHLVAGGATAASLGLVLGEILFGASKVYSYAEQGVQADLVHREIDLAQVHSINVRQNSAISPLRYDEVEAEAMLSMAWLSNQLMAEIPDAWAGMIQDTQLTKWIATAFDDTWLDNFLAETVGLDGGFDAFEARNLLSQEAETTRQESYAAFVQPDLVEYAIELTRQRLGAGYVTGRSATILVIDVSGSMEEVDQSGQTKIEAAKESAQLILSIIAQQNQSGLTQHQLALESFSTEIYTLAPLGTELSQAQAAVTQLVPIDLTNSEGALDVANQLLASAPSDAPRMIIFLSDGLPTISPRGQQVNISADPVAALASLQEAILAGPVATAASRGYCIHTIGFGLPDNDNDPTNGISYDADFMAEIAERSGCGRTYQALDADALAEIYVSIQHQQAGHLLVEANGHLVEGQSEDVDPFTILPDQQRADFTLLWPGSTMELTLRDPAGNVVDENYPNAEVLRDQRFVQVAIIAPAAGTWEAGVTAIEVEETGEPYQLVASSRAWTQLGEVTARGVDIRRGPGTEYDPIDAAGSGETLTVIGVSQDYSWLMVEQAHLCLNSGWVPVDAVHLSGSRVTLDLQPPPPSPEAYACDASGLHPAFAASWTGDVQICGGCPVADEQQWWIEEATFEAGHLIARADQPFVYALYEDGTWAQFDASSFDAASNQLCPEATWAEEPLARRLALAWCRNHEVQERLGEIAALPTSAPRWGQDLQFGWGVLQAAEEAEGMIVFDNQHWQAIPIQRSLIADAVPLQLAYAIGPVGNSDIGVMDYGTGESRVVANQACDEAEPDWFPAGDSVIFQANCAGNYELYAVEVANGATRQLTNTPDLDEREADISPDGQYIVYRVSQKDADRNGDGELWMMDLATGTPQSLGVVGRAPAWSPAGNALLFMSEFEDDWEIYRYDLATFTRQRLTTCATECRWPAWSPDGEAMLYHSTIAAGSTDSDMLWITPSTGGNGVGIVNDSLGGRGNWSARGVVAFNSLDGVEIIQPGGSGRSVLLAGDDYWAPAWSR